MTLVRGTRLGPYEILVPLGAGGMGEVYRARDSKLDREVAIKVLPESVAGDPETLARFEREAKAVAALSHPNILAIFDYGSQGGVSYAVTELLEGRTLRERLDSGPIPLKEALDCAIQVAKGLSAAHERGVVHRDLKSENLFVSRDGHVKILDFGLAKRVEAPAAEDDATSAPTTSDHTQPGTILGTVSYMSPEQVRGLPVDTRSDIFSFGAILYELLTGRRAFKRETASDTMAAILLQEPPQEPEEEHNVSVTLDHVLRHCLEKDRDRRFQTARDVVFALSEASDPNLRSGVLTAQDRSSGTIAPSDTARQERGIRSRLPAIAAVAALILGAAAGLLLWRRTQTAGESSVSARRIAVLPFENLGAADDEYFADGIADDVRGKLTGISGIEVIARASSMPYRKTTKPPEQIAKELGVSYLLTATVRWEKKSGAAASVTGTAKSATASRVQVTPELVEIRGSGAPVARWRDSFDASITDVFQVQSDIASRVAQALGIALAGGQERRLRERPTESLTAYDAYLRGQDALSKGGTTDPPSLRKALAFYEQAVALDPKFADAWGALSTAAAGLYSNGTPTRELANRAKEAAAKAIALAPNRISGYLAMGGYERRVSADYKRAVEEYAKAARIAPNDPSLLGAAALADQGFGRWDDSIVKLRRALRLEPRSVAMWRTLGFSLLRMHRIDEARKALDQALLLAPTNLDALEYKAMTYAADGDLAGARAVLNGAPKEVETDLTAQCGYYYDFTWALDDAHQNLLLRLTPSAFDDDRGVWAVAMADAYALKGDSASAKKYAAEAVAGFTPQVAALPEDAGRRINLALALAIAGRKDEAIREGLKAISLEPIAKDQLWGPYNQYELVRVYIMVGEHEKALDSLEPLMKIPYYLTPKWLAIDPNFAPLRTNPRFERLVARR